MYAINHIKLAAHTSKQSILYEISYTKRDLSPDSENVVEKSIISHVVRRKKKTASTSELTNRKRFR